MLALGFPGGEPLHHRGTRVDIVPVLDVRDRGPELFANRFEQVLQVNLFDPYLDVNIEVFPKAEGSPVHVRRSDVVENTFRLFKRGSVINPFQTIGHSGFVNRADVER